MNDVNIWLSRAVSWRFGSLLFQEPHPARSRELRALMALLPPALEGAAGPLAADTDARNDRYFAVMGPGGCAATESAYDLAAMANRGPLIAEVSAFYEAFEYPARLTSDLAPDHIVIELDFLGFLALKVAYALHEGRVEDREIAASAYADFRDRHPSFWLEPLRDRLHQTEGSSFAHAADWVCHMLEGELRLQAPGFGLPEDAAHG
jgi:TorA maturation chaperone TorD